MKQYTQGTVIRIAKGVLPVTELAGGHPGPEVNRSVVRHAFEAWPAGAGTGVDGGGLMVEFEVGAGVQQRTTVGSLCQRPIQEISARWPAAHRPSFRADLVGATAVGGLSLCAVAAA
jgi:hypothetical protein